MRDIVDLFSVLKTSQPFNSKWCVHVFPCVCMCVRMQWGKEGMERLPGCPKDLPRQRRGCVCWAACWAVVPGKGMNDCPPPTPHSSSGAATEELCKKQDPPMPATISKAVACYQVYPGKADIYLILIVVLTVYSLKHCMLMEDICFQAAYAKLQ